MSVAHFEVSGSTVTVAESPSEKAALWDAAFRAYATGLTFHAVMLEVEGLDSTHRRYGTMGAVEWAAYRSLDGVTLLVTCTGNMRHGEHHD